MRNFFGFLLILSSISIFSCSGPQQLTYFNGIQDTTLTAGVSVPESRIQASDIISINVSSLNADASAMFNAPMESKSGTSNGYLVDNHGFIQFPVLGQIKVSGLSKSQLSALLTKELTDKKLLVDPLVSIRFLNYKVSVLGEVTRPGVYTIPNEKVNLLEALSLAGDITIYGKRNSVLLIRESESGNKMIRRLDMSSQNVLYSPYYYLQANDIVYVEPAVNKVSKERSATVIPIVFGVLSLGIVAITSFAN